MSIILPQPSPIGPNAIVPAAMSLLEARVRAGQAYIASTGVQSITALLGNLRVLISNPNASGKTVYVYAVIVESNSAAVIFGINAIAPTTGLPTTSVPAVAVDCSGSTPVAVIKADPSGTALSGGTALTTFAVPIASRLTMRDTLLKIPMNTAVGINLPFVAIVSANVTICWWEE